MAIGRLAGMARDRAIVGALSHAELVELVVRQAAVIDQLQAAIAQQQALIGRLEAGSGAGGGPGPRRRREHGFSRVRGVPTERVEHAAAVYPHCSTPLAGGWVAWW